MTAPNDIQCVMQISLDKLREMPLYYRVLRLVVEINIEHKLLLTDRETVQLALALSNVIVDYEEYVEEDDVQDVKC